MLISLVIVALFCGELIELDLSITIAVLFVAAMLLIILGLVLFLVAILTSKLRVIDWGEARLEQLRGLNAARWGTSSDEEVRRRRAWDTCVEVADERPGWGVTSIRREAASRLDHHSANAYKQIERLTPGLNDYLRVRRQQ